MDHTSWSALGARPLVFPALALGLGTALGVAPGAPPHALLVLALLMSLPALGDGRRVGTHLLLLLGFGALGAGLARLQSRPPPPDAAPATALLEGRVLTSEAAERCRLTLSLSRWDGRAVDAKVQLSLYGLGECPLPGARVRVPARMQPLEGPQNPGAPDLLSRRLREGTTHRGTADGQGLVLVAPAPGWERWMHTARAALTRDVSELAPTPEAGALFLTLAAGQRAALGPELEEVFSRSGLAHVLSVSGLHVAALALGLLVVLRHVFSWCPLFGRAVEPRQLAIPLAIPLVWAFVAWTGWQPPAVRSALMASVALLAIGVRRSNDALNTLAASAALLLVVDPACIADLSMQLSFLAVLALILLVPALGRLPSGGSGPAVVEGLRGPLRRGLEACWQCLMASVAVTLAGAPLIASVFGRLSLAGLVSNIVCMPLSGLLTLLAAGGAGLHLLSPTLATPVLWAGGWASEVFLWVARFFSAAPLATLPVPPPAPGSTWAYAMGLLLIAVGRGGVRWMGLLLLPLAVVWTLAAPRLQSEPPLRVTFLSVGQGDGIVISAGGRHVLVDAGGVPQGTDTGRRHVLPYLRAQGIERFALVVLSHPHPDHALGLISVLEQIPTERLWLAAGTTGGELSRAVRAAAGDALVEEVERGHPDLRLGEARLEVLGPPPERWELEHVNDLSVVLKVSLGQVSVLLTGDIEAAGEAALEVGPVTVLKAPHHGSRTSSGVALLEQTRPAAVVVTLGRHNRYGFPHPEVAARYRERGLPVYRTDLHGAITLESDGTDVRMKTFLPSGPPVPTRLVVPDGHPEIASP